MRHIKMFGLAALAAVAAMAFIGASSASATSTALCTEHPAGGAECPAGKIYTGHIEGLSTHAVLSGGINILCTHSVILGEALGLASPQVTHVTKLDFLNCSPCTPVVTDETGLITTLKTALNLGEVKGSGFSVLISCFGIHCVYGGTVEGAHTEGGNPGTVTATEVALEKLAGSFFCPEESFWTATYKIVLPNPIYIVQ